METKDLLSVRERILQAAQKLFADKGFWGTSVQDITDAAKVNKAMLFYYFKNKENLYFSIIEGILGKILETLKMRMEVKNEPLEKLGVIMDTYNELCFQPRNFEIFKIMFQDIMGPGERVTDSLKCSIRSLLDLVAAVIEEGITERVFRKVDPYLTALAIVGICYMFARHRHILGEKFNIDDVSPYIQSIILEGILL